MDLHLVRHAWGFGRPLTDLIPAAKAEGYAAIETSVWGMTGDQAEALREHLDAAGLDIVVQIATGGYAVGPHRTVAGDLADFDAQWAVARRLRPRLLNLHSGLDAWPRSDVLAFYRDLGRREADLGVPVAHETHRGRCFHSAWAVRDLLPDLPAGLRFTADFSHWCCVAERLIEDQLPTIRAVAARTLHLHARVGHGQGPQVPDPRHPRWAEAVAAHERWWDLVWEAQEQAGMAVTTLAPEFGPAPYLDPSDDPHADRERLLDICRWQAQRQAERFQTRARRRNLGEARA